MLWLFNPWGAASKARAELAEARAIAESQRSRLDLFRAAFRDWRESNDTLAAQLTFAKQEREQAIADLEDIRRRNSQRVARGNRTKALRRRGALIPFPTNDDTTGPTADLRTSVTG